MKIMLGDTIEKTDSTGEKHWHKAQVELDETDLLRLLVEGGFDQGVNAGAAYADIGTRDAFNLLEAETELLLGAALVMTGGLDKETFAAAREALEARKAKALEKFKARIGV